MKTFKQSQTDPTFVQNPYPTYDAARAMGDVVWWEDYAMPAAVSHRAVRMISEQQGFGTRTARTARMPGPYCGVASQ